MKRFLKLKIGNEQYPALTGIRALGAIAVFFVHLPFKTGFILQVDVLPFFFVLSGFLILYIYYGKTAISTENLSRYFTLRFARIYPVYFLLVSIAIYLRHNYDLLFLIKNYTLTHALFHNFSDIAIQPSWSLSVEESFYFLAPVIMLLIRKYNFFVSLLFSFLLLLIALLISTQNISFLHTAALVFTSTYFGHFVEFYAGAYLALYILKAEKKNTIKKNGTKWTTAGSFASISVIMILVFINKGHYIVNLASIIIDNFILPLAIVILYFGLICEKTFLSGFLSQKILGLLGRTSYSFYLVHTLVIDYIAAPFLLKYFGTNYNLYVIAIFILSQLIAFIIFILYEEPVSLFIRNKLKSKKKMATATI